MELHRELEISLCKEKEMREAALRAVDAKTDFLSRMSHDMRTPMNGILGLTALSADETDAAVLRDNMLKIHASGEYLLGLINDILDSQKIETGRLQLNPQVVHGLSFMEDMLDMVRTIAQQKTIQLRMQIEREQLAGYIRVDPIRAKQICLNLLSNAIKFTPEHGSVTFALTAGDLPNDLRHVVIRVCDNGVGMSEDFLRNGLFHAFAQEYNALSPQNVSTGLGLSIVKRLVDLMGGSIAVESKLGVGSTFTVTLDVERVLPGDAAELKSGLNRAQDANRVMLTGKRILLVEDHPLNLEVARRLLTKMGCLVATAENGQVALECFADSPSGSFDAILMDIRMPVMDGLSAAKAIRSLKNRPDALTVPIIAMTANAFDDDVRLSLAAGMNAHLAKPIEPGRLYQELANQLTGGTKP